MLSDKQFYGSRHLQKAFPLKTNKQTCSLHVSILAYVSISYCAWGFLLLPPGSYEVFRAALTETQKHKEDIGS